MNMKTLKQDISEKENSENDNPGQEQIEQRTFLKRETLQKDKSGTGRI